MSLTSGQCLKGTDGIQLPTIKLLIEELNKVGAVPQVPHTHVTYLFNTLDDDQSGKISLNEVRHRGRRGGAHGGVGWRVVVSGGAGGARHGWCSSPIATSTLGERTVGAPSTNGLTSSLSPFP